MRIKALVGLSFILVSLLVDNACSIYDSTGLSVDELIDESNGIYIHYGPENPQEAREIWSRDSGVDFTKMGKQSNNSTSAKTDSIAAASDSIQYQTTSTNEETSPNAQVQNAAPSSHSDIAGEWIFELRDSKTRQLGLTLFRSEDAVFGEGSINDGTNTLPVLASGSVQGEKLHLDVISSGTTGLYRLTFTKSGDALSGDYKAFSTTRQPWTGIANGMRTQE